ncbi:scarecrow-like protein 34 [Syzygium oleosum]|uniref:scarecrow-like protein 34 n=1 Tax=Syzygium oleosum TaxID=219896 RepID=UPI0024BA28C8|nr:scarecrow-like protein 34 [Syzygium oleosum]XP_056165635.1 scarecrow-like protein 34 [Syzygium oleosum]
MTMDPLDLDYSDCINVDDLPIDSHAFSPNPDQYPSLSDGFFLDDPFLDLTSSDTAFLSNKVDPVYDLPSRSIDLDIGELIFPSTSVSSDGRPFGPSMSSSSAQSIGGDSLSPSGDIDSSDPVLKYISQMLMEENMEEQPWVADQVALQNAEKSLYDALGQQHSELSDQSPSQLDLSHYMESSNSNLSGSSGAHGSYDATSVTVSSSDSADANILYPIEEHSHAGQEKSDLDFQSNVDSSSQLLSNSSSSIANYDDGSTESLHELLVKSIFSDSESMIQFKKGLEEASKFLPTNNQLGINPKDSTLSSETKKGTPRMRINEEINMKGSSDGFMGLKNHERDENAFEEGRANKQTALYTEESELSDLFDKVLLCSENGGAMCSGDKSGETGPSKDIRPQRNKRGSNRGRGRGKKQGSKNTVDLRTLLSLCAQAISTSDFRTANELLKQIRENSSPSGDGSQRMAHYFADGLEARLVDNKTRTQDFYSTVVSRRTSAADILKAYHLHLSMCPFKKFSICFANYMILRLAEKATTLHIIDFGIGFGFQWPILIQKLSSRSEGPCKLRITGIELPQAGFRPAERIEETGRRLKKYCERFNVPFEFNCIASRNWESIKLEDLKIQSDETIAVNCLDRFRNLLDETVEDNNPRDAVLNLIRQIKPDIFVHAVGSGSHNSPFFATRFREALFHMSALYDMYDAILDGDSEERLVFEREFHGREIMNVVACEGSERVERPETYKQWQVRHMRAGFKALPLDQELMKLFRSKMKEWYHKDFVLDEDGNCMLQGWRGRIIYCSSCWVLT